jgi:hypothetical protein
VAVALVVGLEVTLDEGIAVAVSTCVPLIGVLGLPGMAVWLDKAPMVGLLVFEGLGVALGEAVSVALGEGVAVTVDTGPADEDGASGRRNSALP